MATVIENKVWAGVRVVRARLKSIEQFPPGAICCPSIRAALIQYKDVILTIDLSKTFFWKDSKCDCCGTPIPDDTKFVMFAGGAKLLDDADSIVLNWIDIDEGGAPCV